MKTKELNEKELECSEMLSAKEIHAYLRLRDICPNHFKGFEVQADNLAKILGLKGSTTKEIARNLFELLDKFLYIDLIFYESFTEPPEKMEKVCIIFTAFAGLINDGECEECGSLYWSSHE